MQQRRGGPELLTTSGPLLTVGWRPTSLSLPSRSNYAPVKRIVFFVNYKLDYFHAIRSILYKLEES
jgi:hypothetical protein